jgi:hypothetical protein
MEGVIMYCIICGKEIEGYIKVHVKKRTQIRQIYSYAAPVCEEHTETYKNGRLNSLWEFDGFCKVCGEAAKIKVSVDNYRFKHMKCKSGRPDDWEYKKDNIVDENITPKHTYPLKPWRDPESLFCDTEFLNEYFNKKMRPGKECGDLK